MTQTNIPALEDLNSYGKTKNTNIKLNDSVGEGAEYYRKGNREERKGDLGM